MRSHTRRQVSTFQSIEYRRLLAIIRRVRNRWRMKLLLRGLAWFVAMALLTVAVASLGLEWFRYRLVASLVLAAVTWGAVAWTGYRWLLRPLLSRVSDRQVALYIEEHARELDGELLSAIEFGAGGDEQSRARISAQFVDRVVAQALADGARIDYGNSVERAELKRASGYLGVASMAVLMTLLVNPGFLRHAAPVLLRPWGAAGAAAPYRVTVSPGDAQIARGGSQQIRARLAGFDADSVEISYRSGTGDWVRAPMLADDDGYVFELFSVREPTDYVVEASGVRSEVYRLEVVDLPYVQRVDLDLEFPAYTGLSSQHIEDGGDIAVLQGTRVRVRIVPTVAVPAGRIVLEPGLTDSPHEPEALGSNRRIELRQAEGSMTAEFVVDIPGSWRVELDGFDGDTYEASPRYLIQLLQDQPPLVTVDKPGRDVSLTSVEELFVEVSAEDDYGIGRIQLVWSVNGGAENVQELFAAAGAGAPKDTSASHTLYLEEYDLEPGDLISYYARASDNRGPVPGQTVTDIYFVSIRPFRRDYQQGATGGAGGGPGGGSQQQMQLVRRQREIIAATFKLDRDGDQMDRDRREQDLDMLADVQQQLRKAALEAVGRLQAGSGDLLRGVQMLRAAAEAMQQAHESLAAAAPHEALSPEQVALQQLQRAEALVKQVRVAFAQGGGGQPGDMERLEGMFDLDRDQLRNQYETVQRQRQREADNAVDEAMQRLTELARRQQQQIERQRARAGQPPNQAGGARDQRRIAEQAEELARRLERLSRDRSRPDLEAAARRLRDAADSMRKAAAARGEASVGQGARALSELQRARRLLDRERGGRLGRDLQQLQQRAERLQRAQAGIERDVQQLGAAGKRTQQDLQDLMDRKDELAGEIDDLESAIDGLARSSRSTQPKASRELEQAADEMRDSKLSDKVRYSKGVMQERDSQYAQRFERRITEDLEALGRRLESAESALEQPPSKRLGAALQEARNLVRKLESFEDRLRREQDQPGTRGAEPSPSPTRPESAGTGRDGTTDGAVGGAANGVPATRQLRREFEERVRDAEALRERLRREGVQVTDLDEVIAAMRRYDESFAGTTRGLDQLQASVIDGLKLFEFWLRRATDAAAGQRPQLAGSDKVPDGYRQLVQQYFRALAEKTAGQAESR